MNNFLRAALIILVLVAALFLVGLMLAIGDQTPPGPTDLSSQSRTTAPPQ